MDRCGVRRVRCGCCNGCLWSDLPLQAKYACRSLSAEDPLRERELMIFTTSAALFFVGVVVAAIGALIASCRMP